MLLKFDPLLDENNFKVINDFVEININNNETNKYITATLMQYKRETIEEITRNCKQNNISYYIMKDNDNIIGLCNIIKSELTGFELLIMLIDNDYRNKGIGQKILNEIIIIAKNEGYKNIKVDVFADNAIMLRLLLKNNFIITKYEANIRADNIGRVELKKKIE